MAACNPLPSPPRFIGRGSGAGIDPRSPWIFRAFRGVGFVAELRWGVVADRPRSSRRGRGERNARRRRRDRDDEWRTRCIEALWTTNLTGDPMQIQALSILPPPPPLLLLLLAEIARLISVLQLVRRRVRSHLIDFTGLVGHIRIFETSFVEIC